MKIEVDGFRLDKSSISLNVFYVNFYCDNSADMSELCSLSEGRNAQMELQLWVSPKWYSS